jgi:hypothetical protein
MNPENVIGTEPGSSRAERTDGAGLVLHLVFDPRSHGVQTPTAPIIRKLSHAPAACNSKLTAGHDPRIPAILTRPARQSPASR